MNSESQRRPIRAILRPKRPIWGLKTRTSGMIFLRYRRHSLVRPRTQPAKAMEHDFSVALRPPAPLQPENRRGLFDLDALASSLGITGPNIARVTFAAAQSTIIPFQKFMISHGYPYLKHIFYGSSLFCVGKSFDETVVN